VTIGGTPRGTVIAEDIGAWQAGCRHVCDDPVLCGHFRPVISLHSPTAGSWRSCPKKKVTAACRRSSRNETAPRSTCRQG
jgi:hypothetical protein